MQRMKSLWMVWLTVIMIFVSCDSSSTKYYSLNVTAAGDGTGRISSSPSGIDCTGECSSEFVKNTDVTLTAVPDKGSVFAGWEGACTGTESCKVKMDQSYTVTGIFSKAEDTGDSISLRNAGSYRTGIFDEGAAEIPAFDPASGRIFVVNGADKSVDILQAADSGALLSGSSRIGQISVTPYGGGVNSVAVSNGIVAAAVENADKQQPGKIVFFDTDGNFLNEVAAGALPDMIVFTPDGKKVLTANEGEPNDDYSADPEGSVTVADLSAGVANVTAVTVGFAKFNDRADELKVSGVRIFGPNATVSQDVEPEYIAVSGDSSRAWIALQENNAIAVLDIPNAEITDIFPLGYKNHNAAGQGMDASDKDGAVNIRNWPVYGMYQPDSIAVYEMNGVTYLVSANEGDSRDYDGFSEETTVADVTLDPAAFPNAAELQTDENLGRLNITNTLGDTDGDGDFDALYAFGSRSFTVWKVTDTGPEAVFDSGEEMEQITSQRYPDYFNAGNDNNKFDNRSDNKGPEPEGIAVGQVGTRTYAFIGLERMGGIMVYDITEPEQAVFTDYILDRDFTKDAESAEAGDLGPEGLAFVSAADSHAGKALLIAANEISGSTTVYEIESVNTFPLTLVHVSDTHSHLEPTATSLNLNGTTTYLELGGYARLSTKVKAVRSENPNTLVLHAGDAVQGTLYFTKYEGEADFALLNAIGFDAMVTGNHEFDKGPELLSDIIGMADFPIIAANMDVSSEPSLAGKIPPYIIKEISGTKVGIIGLITPETAVISSPGSNITFLDQVTTAQKTVQELEAQGISKIIVLSHLGYEEDIALAGAVEGIDVIVGGHSHTLLGDVTDLGLNPAGPYPVRVYKKSGQDVCIVHSWEWAKAAGVLDLRFDDRGYIRFCRGDAVLLSGDSFQQKDANGNKADVSAEVKNELLAFIAAHPAIEVVSGDTGITALLSPYADGIEEMNQEVIAQVAEDLLHIRVPGTHTSGTELSDGSQIAPVVAEGMLWKARSTGLNVQMSLQNAGGVRIDIPQGDLTVGKSYELLPFGNTLYILELTGAEIRTALQTGVTRGSGAFPYVGGARYTVIDGQVTDAEIRNAAGEWEDINDDTVYLIATNAYLAGGGDGYTVLAEADGYRYDTGFGDAEVFIEYAQTLGTLYRPEETGVIWEPAPQNLTLKIIETTDIHGSLFPYDFIEDQQVSSSLAHIFSYVKAQRSDSAHEVILLDNGDILQGQPIVNYYNFEKDLTQEMHIVAQVMNYMEYDAGTVGNHDIEPGHAVYDELVKQFAFPWLSANALKEDGTPYFTPYTVLERQGVKIAVLGLTTPGIPMWLPESLWSGIHFEDMVRSAQYWVPYIQENEKPDLLIGLFHSGFDYTYNGQDEYTEFNENGAQLVAMNVPGFDIIFIGHDHMNRNETVNGTLILGGQSDAKSAPTATVQMSWNESTQSYEKTIRGELPDLSTYTADADMMAQFSEAVDEVKAYVSQEVGTFTRSVSSRDAMFGDSAFTDIIHQLQFDVVAQHLDPAGADISFCAPLQFDKTIEAGSVYVRDMYKLYRYENQLFLMQMSGQEIKDYLEFNYDKWVVGLFMLIM
ncbi:MAG: choice-of-anchor I family protein [Desulfococcaceae bacterium]